MYNFKDIPSLCKVLSTFFSVGEGEPGRSAFAAGLQSEFEFTPQQAEIYSQTVLSKNSNGSSDWVSRNAYKVCGGRWVRMDSTGSAGNLVVAKTWTWLFKEDLTYEYKYETYEGYTNPFGGGYSRPTSSSELGIWAPSDQPEDTISLVVISTAGSGRQMTLEWLDTGELLPRSCKLNGESYARQW